MLYSVKMRSSQSGRHVSGAERIVPQGELEIVAGQLLRRALHHASGEADLINIKISRLDTAQIRRFPALPVSSIEVDNPAAGLRELAKLLAAENIPDPAGLVAKLADLRAMRGAVLYDVDRQCRWESDPERGVRASVMDREYLSGEKSTPGKNHFAEALVLATKVANAPGIIGELCISDDPDYVTGYFASLRAGYIRISQLKAPGVPAGGRIFLYRGTAEKVAETIEFLENTPVIVTGAALTPPAW